MSIHRVAVIFDNAQRPETTGTYCLRALKGLIQVEHFQPSELDRIPRDGFDFYLNIDDGLRYQIPPELRPNAYCAIDTHLDPAWHTQKARAFDVVFTAQRDGAENLRRAGIQSATWLPLACDPAIHGKHDVAKQYDVAFVGNVFPGPRGDLLNLIRRRYPNTFIGQCYFEEMARTYSAARTVFNRSITNDVNMRVFEGLASGSLLVTNDLSDNGLAELFRDGVHLATYREAEDLLDKLAFYLKREDLRETIAAAGRAEVSEKHTYRHRMEYLLREVEAAFARSVVSPAMAALPGTHRPEACNGQPPAGSHNGYDPTYYSHLRPDLLALVPEAAHTVLDIGCGSGRLGEAIKLRQAAEVIGIEFDSVAASVARTRLDQVIEGDVESLDLPFPSGRFDAIVCGDVLEHLRNPGRLLRQAKEWLTPVGTLVASIPNVRHHSVVRSILEGNWTYESAGLLDQTHLRFFTRREIEKLFFRAGFAIEEMRSVIVPDDRAALEKGNGRVQIGRLSVGGLSPHDAAEFFTYQFLARARPVSVPEFGLTSIVIVTHNQLEYTRQCLDSIARLTDEPYELIVVDNASADGTVDFLRAKPGVRLIVNDANRGFPAAANQGIAASTGRQVLLLNNHVIVTTGWLFRLLRALYSDPTIGMVGPCSNRVSGPQQVEARYDSLSDLDGFAWDWGGAHEGQRAELHRLVGFCLLIKREVIDAIGPLDEQFGIGCFEDDDYCLRAIQAGFRTVIAVDAFIHHFGGRTFAGSGVDFGGILRENGERFRAKWERRGTGILPVDGERRGLGRGDLRSTERAGSGDPRPARETPVLPLSGDPEEQQAQGGSRSALSIAAAADGGLKLSRHDKRPRLSLCMIVRDNERTLPACLESIRPWVDEMVIVDTGSVDDTPRIIESFGGRLFHFPWCDDFSAARNESVRHARGDWVFWMDSDDTIPLECGRGLRALAYRETPAHVLGFTMQVHCPGYGDDGEPDFDVTMVDHVKLFRNRSDLRFDHRIHEQILPAIRAAGGEVAWTDLYVVHSGSDHSPAGKAKKLERDLRILHRELSERPEHPFTLFNLGMTYCHAGRYAEAVDYLERGIARSASGESHLRKEFALLMFAWLRLERHDLALDACRRGRALFPHDAELRFREAVLLQDLGRHDEARRAYIEVMNDHGEERHFSSVDRALTGYKTRQNLAVLALDTGDLADAEQHWREIIRAVPLYRQGWRGLGETLLRARRFAELEALAENLASNPDLRTEGLLIRGRSAKARGSLAEAREALDRAAAERPDDWAVLSERSRFFFDHGTTGEAEKALRALIDRSPEDASAHHNLGTLLMRSQRHDEAAREYRDSLRYRPNFAATYLNLGYALRDSGRIDEAAAAWEQASRLARDDPQPREELAALRGSA